MGSNDEHRPVLLAQVVEALCIAPDGVYIDATFGRGGHSRAILERLGVGGTLLLIDKDAAALRRAGGLSRDARVQAHHGSFAQLGELVSERGWQGRVNGILLDLGVSSPQLDDPSRGFGFRGEGPLDMRMDQRAGVTAAQWLASASAGEIRRVLWEFGEERYARRIAEKIVQVREDRPITTTRQLAELIAAAVPARERRKHPATRSFQAIRIHINRELDDLRAVLPACVDALATGGRLAVISFHSLEDRIVKRFMRDAQRGPVLPPDLPVVPEAYRPTLRVVGRAIVPDAAELEANPRARSARLRVAERCA
jgi:16S rRNA (cytosine1402-N4)-methyltransferase